MARTREFDQALSIIPTITGPISFFSSLYLMYIILKGLRNTSCTSGQVSKRTRDSLLIGLCFLDICGSFGLSFSTYASPIPFYDNQSLGNVQTCEAQGFFVQLGLGTPLYNAALCLYFVLVIRYKKPDRLLAKWMVPAVHLIILPYIFFTAIYGLVTDVFNPAGAMGCWAHRNKWHCNLDPQEKICNRGKNAEQFGIYFAVIHLSVCFVIVVVSMVTIWCTVRGIEARARRWDPTLQTQNARSSTTSRTNEESGDMSVSYTSRLRSAVRSSLAKIKAPRTSSQLTNTTIETGFSYAITYLLVYLPSHILHFVPFERSNPVYLSLLIINAIFLPLQGFFNLLIYTYSEWRPWLRRKLSSLAPLLAHERSTERSHPTNIKFDCNSRNTATSTTSGAAMKGNTPDGQAKAKPVPPFAEEKVEEESVASF